MQYLDSNVDFFTNYFSLEFQKRFDDTTNNKTIIQYINQNDLNKTINIFFGIGEKGNPFNEADLVSFYYSIIR